MFCIRMPLSCRYYITSLPLWITNIEVKIHMDKDTGKYQAAKNWLQPEYVQ